MKPSALNKGLQRAAAGFFGFLLVLAAADLSAQTGKKLAGAAPAVAAPAAGTTAPASLALAARTVAARYPLPAGSIRLENDRPELVYYLVLPLKAGEAETLLGQGRLLAEKLKANQAKLDYLAPRTAAAVLAVGEGEQLVIGLAVEGGANDWGLWYLPIPAKAKRPLPAAFALSQASLAANADGTAYRFALSGFEPPAQPVRVDGRFVDWLKYDNLLAFTTRQAPLAMKRQVEGKAQAARLEESLFWGKAGSNLEQLRAIRGKQTLYLMFSAHSLMSPGLSYLLRFYAAPGAKAPLAVLELPVDAAGGPALAWEPGKAAPTVVGDFAAADYYLEARIQLDRLPAALGKLQAAGSEAWSVECASAYSQPGQYEEFFLGRFPLAQIRLAE